MEFVCLFAPPPYSFYTEAAGTFKTIPIYHTTSIASEEYWHPSLLETQISQIATFSFITDSKKGSSACD
jgi:hypothetical protein